ncbi:hypothetical protein J2Z40_003057 [Cytobacillus eiseniae]|uniref:DUF1642 domain-containing protein n=1 Tax=Cytobacillus eiseniae TaxID=762947 RepID=A0ABS4RIA3_9BACI|nr:hypothetical protein [Cytobacillus eiseniae]
MTVQLQYLIDEMDMQFEGINTYLNRMTGKIISVSEENLRTAEEEDSIEHLPEWQQEELEDAVDIINNFDNYEQLPTTYEINEYDMLEDFCYSLRDGRNKDILITAIQGKGAFRRFKDHILQLGIEEEWYTYRNECYKELAIEWCKEHGIKWVE